MDIKEILNSIELTDEQVAALDQFFEDFTAKISKDAVESYVESNNSEEVEELKKQIEQHKIAFELFEEDVDQAFELFEEHADKAFEKFEEDVDKAFLLYEEELQSDFTVKMVEALDSVYDDLKEKSKQDFLESSEYAAFMKIKDVIAPYLEGANTDLIAKVADLESTIAAEKNKNQELSRKTMIDEFVAGIPEKHANKAKAFLEEAETEDEICQRYDLFLSFLEDVADDLDEPKKRERPNQLKERKIFVENLEKEEDEKTVEPILESKSVETKIEKKEDKRLNAFKPAHKGILAAAGLI